MAASFWFFSSFLAKSISFYFRNQIYTALGFQKYSHCNKVLYISPWTIPFYTSDVSLLTKKSLIFAVFYTCESGVLLKYAEPWLNWLKLTYHPSSITNNVSKNWSMTLKGLRGVVLRALIEKTPNFWPIEPIELKFWHLILIMECLKISLCGSHGSTFGPLWWP